VKRDIWLDVSFLGEELIRRRIPEVMELCMKYRGIDISTEPIPVTPSVHFFMGGFAVGLDHETNIRNLFAVGECASKYHGANRLGGNSLLAAIYGGMTAAEDIAGRAGDDKHPDFSGYAARQTQVLEEKGKTESRFPVAYIRDLLAETMQKDLGIVRNEESLNNGIKDVDYYLENADRIQYDNSVMPYFNFSLKGILTLARAVLTCARSRKESRGSHYRSDYPEMKEEYASSTIISFDDGAYQTRAEGDVRRQQ
jgi:succinate dehydrogenase / fumarate reductase flavoprotein subunit